MELLLVEAVLFVGVVVWYRMVLVLVLVLVAIHAAEGIIVRVGWHWGKVGARIRDRT
jgi:hypothetical protein